MSQLQAIALVNDDEDLKNHPYIIMGLCVKS